MSAGREEGLLLELASAGVVASDGEVTVGMRDAGPFCFDAEELLESPASPETCDGICRTCCFLCGGAVRSSVPPLQIEMKGRNVRSAV